jgi:hypothetical protein
MEPSLRGQPGGVPPDYSGEGTHRFFDGENRRDWFLWPEGSLRAAPSKAYVPLIDDDIGLSEWNLHQGNERRIRGLSATGPHLN